MYAEVGVLDELRLAPFAGFYTVVRFDMAVDCVGRKLGSNVTAECSHMPSRTLKPILSQSASLSARTFEAWSGGTVPMVSVGGGGNGIMGIF